MSEYYVKNLAVNLTLDHASNILETALSVSEAAGLLPLTVAILDTGGHLIALKRQDGSGIMRADIAIGKAWGALGMGISSRTIRDRLADRPSFQAALSSASQGRFIPVPGGVLICNSQQEVIGAIGISGDASDKDEYCAIEAVKQSGFISHPEEAVENWAQAGL